MSTQLKINEDLIQYLQKVGYRKDTLVDELEKETKALGKVAQTMLERTIDKYGLNADMSAAASLFESETGAQIRP